MKCFFKPFSLVLVLAICISSFSACGYDISLKKKEDPATSASEVPSSVEPESTGPEDSKVEESSKEESAPATKGSIETLSDDIYDFQFELDGYIYQLPFKYEDLSGNGWIVEDKNLEEISPNSITFSKDAVKDGRKIMVRFINALSPNTINSKDAYVYAIQVEPLYNFGGEAADIKLAKGITNKSTKDEVIAAYGEPSSVNDTETLFFADYKLDIYNTIHFVFDKTQNLAISEISLENINFDGMEKETADVTNAVSHPYVANYKAPSALGAKWDDFIVEFEGNIYQMPAPVSAFIANGWKVEGTGTTTVDAKGFKVGVKFMKDNKTMSVSVRNYSDSAQPLENCLVTTIKKDPWEGNFKFSLPGGITQSSTREAVETAYGKTYKSEDSSSFSGMTYGEYRNTVYFSFDKKTNEMSTFEMHFEPKEADLPKQ